MSRQKTTIFASLGGVCQCGRQAFFDAKSGNKNIEKDTATPP